MRNSICLPALLFLSAILLSCAAKRQSDTVSNTIGQTALQDTYAKSGKESATPFWSSLFAHVCKESRKENVCISPLSAQLALSMTANGATGETQQQMYSTMNLTGDVNTEAKVTIERLADNRYECEVNIANSIWINDRLNVKESFIDTNKEYFNAHVTTAPFNRETLQAINDWCSNNTKGKIKSALSDIKQKDRMYLVNALYFKGGWDKKFDAGMTEEKPFTREDGGSIGVQMMHQKITTPYYEDEKIQIVTKHFSGLYCMQLVLPAEGVTIEEATTHLALNYEKILGEMSAYQVTLSMPRFQSDFGTSLKEPLKKMGMQRAFSKNAQLDGISDEPLYIDDVFQKTFIKVDEEGAEAAAVTILRAGALSMLQPEKRTVNLNRPFIYIITNYHCKNIPLFIGKVGNPNE